MSDELTRDQNQCISSIALLLDEAHQLMRQNPPCTSNDFLWCNLMMVWLAERFALSHNHQAPTRAQMRMALENFDSDLQEKMLNYYQYVLSVRSTLLEQGLIDKKEPEAIRYNVSLYAYVGAFNTWVQQKKIAPYSGLNSLKVEVDPRAMLIDKLNSKIAILKIFQKLYQIFGFDYPAGNRKILAFEKLAQNLFSKTGHAITKVVTDWQKDKIIDADGEHEHQKVLNEHRVGWLWNPKTTTAKLLDTAMQAENQVLGSCLKVG